MTERMMPAPDVYATCPSGGRVLDYYSGVFEAVYVCLNPFIRPISIPLERFTSETYPNRQELNAGCEPVSWETVRQASGLPSIAAMDVALRTEILGLWKEFQNKEYEQQLSVTAHAMGLISPPEGAHSDFHHDLVLSMFQELGHQWVWVGDEFCSERKLHWIDDLKAEEEPVIQWHCNVFSPDKSLLWTVHWDSHFSFLCGSQKDLEAVQVATRVEGFFCKAETEVYWSIQ